MDDWRAAAATREHPFVAALSALEPAVVGALERAGLAGSGALDAFSDLPDAELRMTYMDLVSGTTGFNSDVHYEAFVGAVRGAGTAAKRHRRALAHAPRTAPTNAS